MYEEIYNDSCPECGSTVYIIETKSDYNIVECHFCGRNYIQAKEVAQ